MEQRKTLQELTLLERFLYKDNAEIMIYQEVLYER